MPKACNFIIKESLAQVFSCEFCKISKNTYFYRTPPVAASMFLYDITLYPNMEYISMIVITLEAVVRRFSEKKVFLKIMQNSQ